MYRDVPKLTVTYRGNKLEGAQANYKWKSKGKEKNFTAYSYASVINKLTSQKITGSSQLEAMTLGGSSTDDEGKFTVYNVTRELTIYLYPKST